MSKLPTISSIVCSMAHRDHKAKPGTFWRDSLSRAWLKYHRYIVLRLFTRPLVEQLETIDSHFYEKNGKYHVALYGYSFDTASEAREFCIINANWLVNFLLRQSLRMVQPAIEKSLKRLNFYHYLCLQGSGIDEKKLRELHRAVNRLSPEEIAAFDKAFIGRSDTEVGQKLNMLLASYMDMNNISVWRKYKSNHVNRVARVRVDLKGDYYTISVIVEDGATSRYDYALYRDGVIEVTIYMEDVNNLNTAKLSTAPSYLGVSSKTPHYLENQSKGCSTLRELFSNGFTLVK